MNTIEENLELLRNAVRRFKPEESKTIFDPIVLATLLLNQIADNRNKEASEQMLNEAFKEGYQNINRRIYAGNPYKPGSELYKAFRAGERYEFDAIAEEAER